MSIKHLYPTSTPALNLNPKSSRVADPRLSCVRNSVGTYVDPVSGLIKTAAAHEARVGEDGLLVEEARTNQLPFSEDYSNWTLWNTTTAPLVTETAPDGSTTCRKLTEGNTDAFTLMGEGSNMVDSTTYTFSFYIKNPSTNAARFCLVRTQANSSPEICTFDMDTLDAEGKPTVNSPSTPVATSIDFDVLPNGWFRFYCTFPCNDAGTNREVQIGINETNSISLETYTGDGTSGFLIWGAQLEQSGFPTSYIPTSGSTYQRLADEITLTNSGIFNPNSFTTINEPFGVAGGSDTLTVVGDGLQTRDFINVSDIASANLTVAEKDAPTYGEVYNIGTGRELSVRAIAEMISDDIVHIPPRPAEARKSLADTSKIESVYGWKAKIKLEDWISEQ